MASLTRFLFISLMLGTMLCLPAKATDLVEEQKKGRSSTTKKLREVPDSNKESIFKLVSGVKTEIGLNPSEQDHPCWAWDPLKEESQKGGWKKFIEGGGKAPLYLADQKFAFNSIKGAFYYVIDQVYYVASLDLIKQQKIYKS